MMLLVGTSARVRCWGGGGVPVLKAPDVEGETKVAKASRKSS